MATTPGVETTEYKLTRAAFVAGAILEGLAATLDQLKTNGFSASWFPAVLAVVGLLLQLATILGYTKSRTLVKAEALRQAAPDALGAAAQTAFEQLTAQAPPTATVQTTTTVRPTQAPPT